MDISWIITENLEAFKSGRICGRSVAEAILTAVSMSEVDTMQQYQKARNALCEVLKEWPGECDIICRMMDKIIADEADHSASAQKAAMKCSGNTEPKAAEYNEAVKESDKSEI